MQIRTPQRYRPGVRQERRVFNLRWAWLWLAAPMFVFIGWQVLERRDEFAPPVQEAIGGLMDNARVQVATLNAPTPLPTQDPGQSLAQANAAWGRGAIEEAVTQYAEVVRADPNNTTAHLNYTFGLIMQGQDEEALAAAQDAVTVAPYNADAWAMRALALGRAEQYPAAIASGMQALQLNPNHARALAFMAEAYLDMGDPERAESTIARALEADPENPEALHVNGLIAQAVLFDVETAREQFRAAYDLAPNLPYIGVELAWAEFNNGNIEGALEIVQTILDGNPQSLDALYAAGFLDYQYNFDVARASEYMTRCLAADPQNIPCLRYLGGLQSGVEAAGTYSRLLAAGTQRPQDFFNAGGAFINNGDCAGAIEALRQGYGLEAAGEAPDTELLASFESRLAECGAGVTPADFFAQPAPETTPAPEATVEAET